jgi:transposase-like protein
MDVDDFWKSVEASLARRDFVFRHVPHCPKCREQMQIQIMDYHNKPAKWRCRMCKHRFEFEPPEAR